MPRHVAFAIGSLRGHSAGPADRPAGVAEEDTDSSVDPQEPDHGGPTLPTGDGG